MKRTKKILSSLSLLSFLLISNTGCAPKNSDGRYYSVYSYHPYNHYNVASKANYSIPERKYFKRRPMQRTETQKVTKKSNRPINDVNHQIESTAKSLLGKEYQYGASGPYKYDCSGFTKYVFSKQGVNLPRVAKDQARVGRLVNIVELQKGDLIFFDSKKSSEVSHVGIYLGKGDFIHASSAQDKVTISNLSSGYYSQHFKWGRRLIKPVTYAYRQTSTNLMPRK